MVLARILFILSCLAASFSAFAEDELRVIGLFKNAAMVEFAGKQKLYRAGQNVTPDIRLVKADSKRAIFLIQGKEVELGLESTTSFGVDAAQEKIIDQGPKTVRILRDQSGHYFTGGFINGIAVTFLVDTGATTIAMNETVAKLIGIPYEMQGIQAASSTANGLVATWVVNLNKVRVGEIELYNVQGTVIKGTGPGQVLLGMSFLDRVNMQTGGNLLVLTNKY